MELRANRPPGRRAPATDPAHAALRGVVPAGPISESDFPFYGTQRDKLRFLLRYALLAPSPYNTQPWLFCVDGGTLEVLPDRRRVLSRADPRQRQLLMSSGGLLAALRLAARHFGYHVQVNALPAAEVIAKVELAAAAHPDSSGRSLFLALPQLRRHVTAFDPAVPSAPLLDALAMRAQHAQVTLCYARAPDDKDALRAIATLAQARCMADTHYRSELEQWIRPAVGQWCDGMPQAREQRLNAVPEFGVTEWSDLARLGGWAQRHAAGSMARMASCPVLAVLATPGDAPADWLAAGALLLDLELLARASGVWLAEFNQAVELPDLRARLAQCSGLSGHPQVLLGLGYGAEVPPLPRRPVDEMLLPDHSPAFSMH